MFKIIKLIIISFFICCAGNNTKMMSSKKAQSKIIFDIFSINQIDSSGLQLYLNLPNSIFVFKKEDRQFNALVRISASVFDNEKKRITNYSWKYKSI